MQRHTPREKRKKHKQPEHKIRIRTAAVYKKDPLITLHAIISSLGNITFLIGSIASVFKQIWAPITGGIGIILSLIGDGINNQGKRNKINENIFKLRGIIDRNNLDPVILVKPTNISDTFGLKAIDGWSTTAAVLNILLQSGAVAASWVQAEAQKKDPSNINDYSLLLTAAGLTVTTRVLASIE